MRVLIVDDDAVIRRLVGSILVRNGVASAVVYADDGEMAWQMLHDDAIDLVITDYSMPGMNGLELLRRIRATPAYAALPVIMLTGTMRDDATANEAAREGADGFLTKLLSPDTLLPVVAQALRKSA